MAATRHVTTMPVTLPTEIIIDEIFTKLPVKTLLRFKCVSKSYNAIISSSEFIQLHLKHSLSLDAANLLVLLKFRSKELYAIDIDSNGTPTTTVSTKIPFPDAINEDYYWAISITGSCNGLLCVGATPRMVGGNQAFKYFLINPSTGVCREIPLCVTDYRASVCGFGFGFDDTNNDYKVVHITQIYDRYDLDSDEEICDRVVRVFSLNENAWKVVDNVVRSKERIGSYASGVLVRNSLLHWVFWAEGRFQIGCFDVQSEKWVSDVPLMKSFSKELDQLTVDGQEREVLQANIGVLHECLCLTGRTNFGEVVWMMKDYGVEASWIKLFHTSSSFIYPCCFNGTGPYCFRKGSKVEVLVRNTSRVGGLLWCYIGSETHGITEEISGVPGFSQACFLKGSLVPIPGGKRIEAPEAIP